VCAASSKPALDVSKAAAAVALATVMSMGQVEAAKADIAGLTPCSESKAYAKRLKQEVKGLNKRLKNVREGWLGGRGIQGDAAVAAGGHPLRTAARPQRSQITRSETAAEQRSRQHPVCAGNLMQPTGMGLLLQCGERCSASAATNLSRLREQQQQQRHARSSSPHPLPPPPPRAPNNHNSTRRTARLRWPSTPPLSARRSGLPTTPRRACCAAQTACPTSSATPGSRSSTDTPERCL
jgi:hypothetical protein